MGSRRSTHFFGDDCDPPHRKRIWVDFNDVADDGTTDTLWRFGEPVDAGDLVLADDDEGNVCEGRVVSIEAGLAHVQLDMATFRAASHG